MVEFANHLQETGLSKLEAIIGGASTRLRPILMTTAATVFGHFPLVLATGPGAGARNCIGIMLVSGMIIGTNGKTARIAIHSKGRIRLLGSECYMGSKCHFRKKNGSRCGANAPHYLPSRCDPAQVFEGWQPRPSFSDRLWLVRDDLFGNLSRCHIVSAYDRLYVKLRKPIPR
jgi:hypothetical protein